jgi:antitoxin component HigA of HigAB toxin-antitoxin module
MESMNKINATVKTINPIMVLALLRQRKLKQKDLVPLIGRNASEISNAITGKNTVVLEEIYNHLTGTADNEK